MNRFSPRFLGALAITVLFSGAAAVAAETAKTYQIDTAHTSVAFRVRHMMVSWTKGTFGDVKGTAVIDDANPSRSSVEVTIGVASVDTQNAKRDEHLRSADFFDAAKFPTMTFKSKSFKAAGPDTWQVKGDLTMRGATQEVTLDVTGITPEGKSPWGTFVRGASISGKLSRKDFGLTYNSLLETGGVAIGDEVQLMIEVELMRKDDTAKP